MKNKKTLYLLIPLVLVIWGLILHKVFTHSRGDALLVCRVQVSAEENLVDTTRYVLRLGYPDPFLRSAPKSSSARPESKPQKNNRIKQIELSSTQTISRPKGLVYHGIVSGKQESVGLLELEGKQTLVRPNDQLGSYLVKAVEADHLTIIYMDNSYTYEKL